MGHAKVVVFGDLNEVRIYRTRRTIWISAYLEGPERLLEGVIGEDPARKVITKVQ